MNIRNKILISTLSIQNSEDTDEILAKGYGLEIFADELPWTEENKPDDFFAFYGYPVSTEALGLHVPFFDLNLASEKFTSIRNLTVRTYCDWIKIGRRLGCRYVVVHPHSTAIIYNPSKTRKHVTETLRMLAEKAEKLGILLTVENIGSGRLRLFDQDEFIWLIKNTPGLFALLDVGHAFINKWDIPCVIQSLGEKLVSLHLHDNNGENDEHLPISKGKMDWLPLWDELARLPIMPNLVLEYNKSNIRQIIASAEEIEKVLAF